MNRIRQEQAKILVIDSDPLTLTAVAAMLHLVGHECHCARDREAALKAVRGLQLDLVICDVDLEDISGIELWREMTEQAGMSDVPVIFVCGQPAPDAVRNACEDGGVYYLSRPYDPDVLLQLVDQALWMPHLVNTRIRRVAGHFKVALPHG